jgi:hypothetical protein
MEAFRQAFNDTIVKAISLAQLIATQRAEFTLIFPLLHSHGIVKKLKDQLRSNVDEEFNDFEKEIEATVWYVVKPAFVRYGNAMGQDFEKEKHVLVKAFVAVQHFK